VWVFIHIQTLSAQLVKKTNYQSVIYAPVQVTYFAHIDCNLITNDSDAPVTIPTSQEDNPKVVNTLSLFAAPYDLNTSMNYTKMSQYLYLKFDGYLSSKSKRTERRQRRQRFPFTKVNIYKKDPLSEI